MRKPVISAILTIVMLLIAATATAQVIPPKPRGMPADARPFGKTYGEWSAAWWKWALSLPATEHPLFDTAPCSTGQSGQVWFLGGKFCSQTSTLGCNSPTFTADRACTVPSGKALFFPVLNAEDAFIEEPPGTSEQTMRSNVKSWEDPPNLMVIASIDDWPLQAVRICSSGSFCAPEQSPLFTFTLPDHDNLLAAIGESWVPDGETSAAVSDGYYILLPPLPAGPHTIHFYGMAWTYSVDATYHITIQPGNQ